MGYWVSDYYKEHDMDKLTDPIVLESREDFALRYGRACDAAFRVVEAKVYDRVWDDDFLHTSDLARAITTAVFGAIGIELVVGGEDLH